MATAAPPTKPSGAPPTNSSTHVRVRGLGARSENDGGADTKADDSPRNVLTLSTTGPPIAVVPPTPSPRTSGKHGMTVWEPRPPEERLANAAGRISAVADKCHAMDVALEEDRRRVELLEQECRDNEAQQAELLRNLCDQYDSMVRRGIDTRGKFRWSRETMGNMLEACTTDRQPFFVAKHQPAGVPLGGSSSGHQPRAPTTTSPQRCPPPSRGYPDVVGVDWRQARRTLTTDTQYATPSSRPQKLRSMIAETHAAAAATDLQRVARGYLARAERRRRQSLVDTHLKFGAVVLVCQRAARVLLSRVRRRRRADGVADVLRLDVVERGSRVLVGVARVWLRKVRVQKYLASMSEEGKGNDADMKNTANNNNNELINNNIISNNNNNNSDDDVGVDEYNGGDD
eukprot:PhM_4_TR15169/c0_g1_i1/m.15511